MQRCEAARDVCGAQFAISDSREEHNCVIARTTSKTHRMAAGVVALSILVVSISSSSAQTAERLPQRSPAAKARLPAHCPAYTDINAFRTTNFTDFLNTTVAISPRRAPADVPLGSWISGRATYYGTDERWERLHTACGDPAGQYGVLADGSCGYTNSDGSLPFPKETYVAAADTNEDYPGSCGRCYQVRCRTGAVQNNGRTLRVSDVIYYRPLDVKDNQGRDWPGNPYLKNDTFYVSCWDDDAAITVRVSDSCPCQYPIKDTGEIRTQYWCCGGNNHFDLSFWAFSSLAHPSYGVMPIEYRPVDCETKQPLRSVPGYIDPVIYNNTIGAGWGFQPYSAKNTELLAAGEGVNDSSALCSTLSQDGALAFICRNCSIPGYQPFAKARALRFDIRSNTRSKDPYASSTPPGALPRLKMFMMNDDLDTYCGAELNITARFAKRLTPAASGWYNVTIPLSTWRCNAGSVGSLAAVDRFDMQNTNIREANICLDNIALV